MDKTPPREIKVEKPVEVDQFVWQIPICCREQWDSCKHLIGNKKQPKQRRNIGL